MAEFVPFRNNVGYPIYGLPYVIGVPLLDADGDPVSPSSPDSEISKNGDTAADCTNELVEISGITGGCYLSLTGTELTCDMAYLECASTGAKTTHLTIYPKKLVTIRTGTSASAGSSTSTIVLDGSASALDDAYNGMICAAVIDSTTEVRVITDYVGSTKTVTVVPDWNTAPDNDDTFTILLPDGVQIQQTNTTAFGSVAGTFSAGRPEVNTTHAAGTAWGSGAITTTSIADGAITDAKFTVPSLSAPATGVLGMIVQLWRRFFKQVEKDTNASTITTLADDNTTPITTQEYSSADGVDTVGPAT